MYLINLYKKNVFRLILHPMDSIIISPSREGKKVDLEYLFLEIYHYFFNHNSIFILWLAPTLLSNWKKINRFSFF
jgi:hypothetical protein